MSDGTCSTWDNFCGYVMKSFGLRIVTATCLLLSVGVIINVVFLQRGTNEHELSKVAQSKAEAVAVPGRKLVQAVQRELGAKGYLPKRPDGRLDVVTRAAILAFETDNNLPLTANPSDQLLQALLLGAAVQAVTDRQSPGDEVPKLIRVVQHLLSKHGCGNLDITGKLDSPTMRAIVHCQGKLAITTDGRITASLVAKLQA